ncbi:hypothetical protein [Erythrobacter sp. CCH5-A1]|jgi:hypothetical protein|uniref:hypothetical protein n=1 Tax=Erythrobacter sp. CCH5-A1 TaxID=1768792 RepID=UPI00082F0C47|nr:hypothetical protein [Erythrobacter sp. CCH5-A1]
MEQGKFNLSIAGLVGLLMLASSPLGAMLGLFLAFTVAFFVAPFLWMLAGALGTDLNTIMQPALITLGVLYGAWALAVVAMLVTAIRNGNMPAARLHIATLAWLAAVPLILWLSSEALVKAWP